MTRGPHGLYLLPPLRDRAGKGIHRGSPMSPNCSSRDFHDRPVQVYLHVTVGRYAGDIATLCDDTRPPRDRVSAHVVLREDGNDATQLVPWLAKAWTQSVGNDAGLSIEMSCLGKPEDLWAKWSREERQRCLDQWHTAARIAGFWCKRWSIPDRWAMVHGGPYARGLLRHKDLIGIGSPPSSHTDPTEKVYGEPSLTRADGSPSWLWWVALVQHEVERGDFLPSWGID